MKRLLAIVLALSLTITLAACGGGKTPSTSGGASSASTSGIKSGDAAKLDYPTEPITLMCAWTAGGGSDLLCRALAADSKDYIGTNMNVTNRDGAGGTIGFAEAVDYDNDGYELIFSTSGVFSTQPLLREVEYSIDDFDFICGLTFEPLSIVVPASMGVSNVAEWLDYVNGNQIEVVVGTSGSAGSIPAFGAEDLFPNLGLNSYNIVNYTGSGEVIPALLSGEINCGYFHPHEAKPYLESGDFVVLGVATEERMSTFPDLPTLKEQGIEHINNVSKGIIAPTGLAPEIRDYLETSILKIAEEGPNFKTWVENSGSQVQLMSGADFRKLVEDQTKMYEALIG